MSQHIVVSDEIIAARHHLHEYPELSFEEFGTTKYLRSMLEHHGIHVLETKLETGLVAQIDGTRPGPRVALRADIDALPIVEHSGLAFSSKNVGVMHACGHDIHMSGLLAAAFWLSEHRDVIAGSVVIVFQPAEENAQGAQRVVESGALGNIDAIIGTHNTPDYAPGEIAVSKEPMMAGCVRFEVTLHAQGSHAAHPDRGTGPIEALASMILSLQTIVSRNTDPFHRLVLSVTAVHGGGVWNVIPEQAGFLGTVRYFTKEDGDMAQRRFRSVVQSTAQAYGITADITWDIVGKPLVSDARLVEAVAPGLAEYAQPKPVIVSMGGEDFCNYSSLAPMLFASVGSNGQPGHHSIHNPEFIALDEAIKPTAEFYVNAAIAVAHQVGE